MPHASTRSPLPYRIVQASRAARYVLSAALLCLLPPVADTATAAPDGAAPRQQAIQDVFRLDAEGEETPLSIRGIDWRPGGGAMHATGEDWFALLEPDTHGASIALASQSRNGTRRAVLGANPLNDLVRPHRSGGSADAATEAWFDNLLGWLLADDMPFAIHAPALSVVVLDVIGPEGTFDDSVTRDWLAARAPQVRLSTSGDCTGERLAQCLASADLLLIGPGGTDAAADAPVTMSHALSVPVLYLHHGSASPDDVRLNALGVLAHAAPNGWHVVRAGAPTWQAPTLAAARPAPQHGHGHTMPERR